jgi:hypothetical protein
MKSKILAAILIIILLCAGPCLAAVALDGHSSGTSTGSTTATVNITTTGTNRIVVVCSFQYSNTGVAQRTILGVADVAGLTWTARGLGVGGNFNTNNQSFAQCHWALAASALTADTITVTASGATDTTALFVTGWSGVNTSTPFDVNGSLPAYASNLTAAVSDISVAGVSTTNANTCAFALFTTNNNVGGALPTTAPTGFTNTTDITNVSNASTFNDGQSATEVFTSAQSGITVTFNPGNFQNARWLLIVDALQQASASTAPPLRSLLGVGK